MLPEGNRHEERRRPRGLGVNGPSPGIASVVTWTTLAQTGKWDGAVEAENANKAVGDPLAIVYIGTTTPGRQGLEFRSPTAPTWRR